jgi:hypothetical protein
MRLRPAPMAVLVLLVEVKKLLCRSCSCCCKKPLSIFCLELSFFFCASRRCGAGYVASPVCAFAFRSASQRPNNLNASLRLVLGYRDSFSCLQCKGRSGFAEIEMGVRSYLRLDRADDELWYRCQNHLQFDRAVWPLAKIVSQKYFDGFASGWRRLHIERARMLILGH